MTEEGKYIYCIIGENKETKLNLRGIDNQEVGFICVKDIAAVVSPSPIIDFDRLSEKELTGYVAVHQKVNEEVMSAKSGEYDIVPMAFGIIAPNNDEVVRILEKAYFQFKTALRKIAGKVEFVVQVCWDQKKILEELMKKNSEIQQLKQKISTKTGILNIPTKLKLGKLIQQEAEAHKQAYLKDIQALLKNPAHDFTSNKLMRDEMIANFSFLIERTKELEFDQKMQELGDKYGNELSFKYVGPMPPYSFVNINLSLGNFALIDEARNTLGLTEQAYFEEIKNSYRSLAHQFHPDKHSDKEELMKRITEAYQVLENYCHSWDDFIGKKENPANTLQSGGQAAGRQMYSFKEEDVKNSLIIK
ncbi:MAG: GvpL/GvpF family gas vesicle protein [Patescibacteria group bacterium]